MSLMRLRKWVNFLSDTVSIDVGTLRYKSFLIYIAVCLCCLLLFIEVLSVASWLLYPITLHHILEGFFINVNAEIFHLTFSLTPVFLFLTLFSWVFRLISYYIESIRVFRIKIGQKTLEFKNLLPNFRDISLEEEIQPKKLLLITLCSFLLVLTYVIYPHLPTLNPDLHQIGVDVPLYLKWLNKIDGEGLLDPLYNSFFKLRDRSLALLFIYLVEKIMGLSNLDVIRYMPLFLGPLLIFSAFFFMREASNNLSTSIFAMLFTAFSFPVIVGMYGALLSNWLALSEVFIFSGLLLRFIQRKSMRFFLLAISTLLLLLFTHVYTWAMLMVVLFTYLILLFIRCLHKGRSPSDLKIIMMIMCIIGISLVVDFLRNIALGSFGLATETLKISYGNFSLSFAARCWDVTVSTLKYEMAGFYGNPIAFFLALMGSFITVLGDIPLNLYLTSWLIASSFPFVFGNRIMQPRILYNLPINVFEAFAVIYIIKFAKQTQGNSSSRILCLLLIAIMILMNINYGFRCMFTLSQIEFHKTSWEG